MSRIAIISDVHANIDSLKLILKDIEKKNCDKIICLGDLVTKYFYPAEVVDAIRENCDIVLKGNCDNLVATDERYKFARGKLGLDKIEYMDQLPVKEQLIINKAVINMFHSTPESLDAMFNPIFSDNKYTRYKDKVIPNDEYSKMFISEKPQISIVGHTHNNYIGIEKGKKLNIIQSPIVIPNTQRAIINVGSAGEHSHMQKNENGEYVPIIDNFLTYAIIDDKNIENGIKAEIVKVPYKDTLKEVYFNMIDLQNKNKAPKSPIDTKKVHDSLVQMDVDEDELEDEKMKRGL